MRPFDDEPMLGPLRDREQVLAAVMDRGRTLRRRHRALVATPAAATAFVLALAIVSQTGSPGTNVKTVPAGPNPTTATTAPISPAPAGPSAAPTGRAAAPGPLSAAPRPAAAPGNGTAGAPSSTGAPASTDCPVATSPEPQPRRACWPTPDGPGGNYKGTDPNARGCVVHNFGSTTAVQSAFFCSYDATKVGGYTSNGRFNMIRITRGNQVIIIDGYTAPRCATGVVLPGDHVYVDGRNEGVADGYTTTSVGDVFHC